MTVSWHTNKGQTFFILFDSLYYRQYTAEISILHPSIIAQAEYPKSLGYLMMEIVYLIQSLNHDLLASLQ